MIDKTFDAAALVDAAAPAVGLAVDAAHRPGVVLNVERIAAAAKLVLDFPLPDEVELGPVFTP